MRIQINSDKNIVADTKRRTFIKGEVTRVLKRFVGKLTRVEIHLSDVNSHKAGALDKRCLAEARPGRYRPITATSRAAKIEGAVKGALTKLQSSLETFFGRLSTRRAATARAVAPRTQRTVTPARSPTKRKAASRPASAGQLKSHKVPKRSKSSSKTAHS